MAWHGGVKPKSPCSDKLSPRSLQSDFHRPWAHAWGRSFFVSERDRTRFILVTIRAAQADKSDLGGVGCCAGRDHGGGVFRTHGAGLSGKTAGGASHRPQSSRAQAGMLRDHEKNLWDFAGVCLGLHRRRHLVLPNSSQVSAGSVFLHDQLPEARRRDRVALISRYPTGTRLDTPYRGRI